jgi:hypothetical protein
MLESFPWISDNKREICDDLETPSLSLMMYESALVGPAYLVIGIAAGAAETTAESARKVAALEVSILTGCAGVLGYAERWDLLDIARLSPVFIRIYNRFSGSHHAL